MLNEIERRTLIRQCLQMYYEEDKIILIDASMLQVTCSMYMVYNLIFFGNKVKIFKNEWNKIQRISKEQRYSTADHIFIQNAKFLIEDVGRDKYGDYEIVEGEKCSKIYNIKRYLKNHPNSIYYLSDKWIYRRLVRLGLKEQLYFLQKYTREVNPFADRINKFETIGALRLQNGKMYISPKEGTLVRVYRADGIEKSLKDIIPGDIILIRGQKMGAYSFNIYEVVSYHSRNQAMKIIWTDLKNEKRSNPYIERLPYLYRNMILSNTK